MPRCNGYYTISRNELCEAAVVFIVVYLHSSACKHCGNFALWSAMPGNARVSFHFQFFGRCASILDNSANRMLENSFWYSLQLLAMVFVAVVACK